MTDAQITLFGLTMNPPRSVEIFGISFFWSGLFVALAFLAAVIYTLLRCRKFGLKDDHVTDALILAVPAAVIGARLFYVLGNLSTFVGDAAGIIRIWDGGLSVLGGAVFGLLAVCLYCRKKNISFLAMLDAAGVGLLLGTAVASWGDFFGRTGFGNVTNLPWKMGLTVSGETVYVHPLFLYFFILLAAGFIALHIWSRKHERAYDGQLFAMAMVWFCFVQVILLPAEFGKLLALQGNRLLAALILCAAVIVLVHNRIHGEHSPEMLFANGGPAFPNLKKTKKGRYGTYYDDEINDETDELAVGATYDLPVTAAEEQAEEAAREQTEEEDDGFEPFGSGGDDEGFEPFGAGTEKDK